MKCNKNNLWISFIFILPLVFLIYFLEFPRQLIKGGLVYVDASVLTFSGWLIIYIAYYNLVEREKLDRFYWMWLLLFIYITLEFLCGILYDFYRILYWGLYKLYILVIYWQNNTELNKDDVQKSHYLFVDISLVITSSGHLIFIERLTEQEVFIIVYWFFLCFIFTQEVWVGGDKPRWEVFGLVCSFIYVALYILRCGLFDGWRGAVLRWFSYYLDFYEFFFKILEFILLALVIIVPLLISIAYYTLAERKIMAAIQRRKGPNVVGFWGLLQPLADGLKLVIKEMIIPRRSNILLFIFAPMLTLILSFLLWAVIPFNFGNCFVDLHLGVLYILAVSGLAVYGVVIAGWASNSKYSFLGALRASAQMISYEVSISLAVVQVVLVTGSLNLTDIVLMQKDNVYNIFLLSPTSFIFFISVLAETNRAPFDLAEAEAEIVAGIYLEYSAIIFAMFFLGEYCNMIAMSALMNTFFFGGWHLPYFEIVCAGEVIFAVKTVSIAFLFIVVRAMLPRYRYDQLMIIGWKVFLPVNLGFLIFSASILFGFDILPNYASL